MLEVIDNDSVRNEPDSGRSEGDPHSPRSFSSTDKSVKHIERSGSLAEAYQQGTQGIVNLAFSLIVATTIGIILKFVLGS